MNVHIKSKVYVLTCSFVCHTVTDTHKTQNGMKYDESSSLYASTIPTGVIWLHGAYVEHSIIFALGYERCHCYATLEVLNG